MTTARPSSSAAGRAREVLAGLPARAAGRYRAAWVRIAVDGVVAVVAFLLAQVLLVLQPDLIGEGRRVGLAWAAG